MEFACTVLGNNSSSINCIDSTFNFQYILTGMADGMVVIYDFFESMKGTCPLTLTQKQGLCDTIENVALLNIRVRIYGLLFLFLISSKLLQ